MVIKGYITLHQVTMTELSVLGFRFIVEKGNIRMVIFPQGGVLHYEKIQRYIRQYCYHVNEFAVQWRGNGLSYNLTVDPITLSACRKTEIHIW